MGATIAIISIIVIMTLVGYFYIRGAMAEAETAEGSIMSRCNYSEFTAKQEYVRTHLDKFGCKDNGSSLDDREIYVIFEQAMGLQPLDSNNSN